MADDDRALVEKLKILLGEAYKAYPNSCSHSVWYVITKFVDEEFKWMNANNLIEYIGSQTTKWQSVTMDKGLELTKNGNVVIGGLKDSPNGHVIAMYPGAKKTRGGYSYINKEGQSQNVARKGSYPLAMSTSIGSWPGAMSNGDKTVWDPWGNDVKLGKVKFWTPVVASPVKPQ